MRLYEKRHHELIDKEDQKQDEYYKMTRLYPRTFVKNYQIYEDYQIQKYLSEKFLGIGTDGGGICYGFCLDKNYSIFKCPLGDLDINQVVIVAKSTKDFFKKAMMEKL